MTGAGQILKAEAETAHRDPSSAGPIARGYSGQAARYHPVIGSRCFLAARPVLDELGYSYLLEEESEAGHISLHLLLKLNTAELADDV